jgi:hypothetical protein
VSGNETIDCHDIWDCICGKKKGRNLSCVYCSSWSITEIVPSRGVASSDLTYLKPYPAFSSPGLFAPPGFFVTRIFRNNVWVGLLLLSINFTVIIPSPWASGTYLPFKSPQSHIYMYLSCSQNLAATVLDCDLQQSRTRGTVKTLQTRRFFFRLYVNMLDDIWTLAL